MSQRHSRGDKGKWVVASSTRRRPPVQIPPCDNAELIEANKLTLIGRVTNPAIQKPIGIHGVGVNGLENLEMCLPLQLPSGEVISVDLEIQRSQDNSRQSCYRDSKDSSRLQVRGGHSHSQLSPHDQSRHSSHNSVHRSENSRKRPPRTQRDPMNSSRSRDRRPALEAPPSPAQFEPPIELDRALALLGFASLSL
ncbi:hypothetical protein Bca4012_091061 [Brassica carinata]|uniref:Uncharacterized protein n=1 Tax=Brassica carinata TaxID=52824 RepID=A0A8X7QRC8_BRACI|nr:hypothetical protein Bca52824_085609 [Brassica carinata]KAG2272328.1 hypothetical protein Bca52824_066883 [Brassica carinata]